MLRMLLLQSFYVHLKLSLVFWVGSDSDHYENVANPKIFLLWLPLKDLVDAEKQPESTRVLDPPVTVFLCKLT